MNKYQSSSFQQNQSVKINEIVNSIVVNKTGSFVCLGGKKQLQIIDLETLKNTKNILQRSKWEVNVVDWNQVNQNLIASSSNQEAFIWDIENSKYPLLTQITSHQRSISDLSWSLFDQNILATTSADSYINLWDLRSPNKANKIKSFCSHIPGAIQVKWNKFNSNILASAHESNLMIWDLRKESVELNNTVHLTKVYGIDWSPDNQNEILTCSQDKTIKIWSYMNKKPIGTIPTGNPVLRAKYLPQGKGIVSVSERGENHIRLWSSTTFTDKSVAILSGHTDSIRSFDFRVKNDPDYKDVQIVSWSKDQTLKLWKLENSLKFIFNIETYMDVDNQSSQFNSSGASLDQNNSIPSDFNISSPINTINSNANANTSNLSPLSSNASYGEHYIDDNVSNTSSTGSKDLLNSPAIKPLSTSSHSVTNTPGGLSTVPTSTDEEYSGPKDLEYELKVIQNKFIDKSLKIEQIDARQRMCLVTCTVPNNYNVYDNQESTSSNAKIDSTIFQMKVSFPSLYPNGAVPSFDLVTFACNTSLKTNTTILASLQHVALRRVAKSLPCFEQCLQQLVYHIKQSVIEKQQQPIPFSPSTKTTTTSTNNSALIDSSLIGDDHFQTKPMTDIFNSSESTNIILDQSIMNQDHSQNSYKKPNGFIPEIVETKDQINLRKSNNRIDIPGSSRSNPQILSKSPSSPPRMSLIDNKLKNIISGGTASKTGSISGKDSMLLLQNYKDPISEESSSLSPNIGNGGRQWVTSPGSSGNGGELSLSSHRNQRIAISVNENQPCPRLCGIAFGGLDNRIITFTNQIYIHNSSNGLPPHQENSSTTINTERFTNHHNIPRTYKELLSIISPTPPPPPTTPILANNPSNHFKQSNLEMLYLGTPPASPSFLSQSPSLKPQLYLPPISSGPSNTNTSATNTNSNNLNSNDIIMIPKIKIFNNLPSFSALNAKLANSYVLSGKSMEEICNINQELVASVNRKDLVKLWSTLRLITDPKLYQKYSNNMNSQPNTPPMPSSKRSSLTVSNSSTGTNYKQVQSALEKDYTQQQDDNWPCHPLGRPLVQSLMKHYQKIGDIQTLAMISCFLMLASKQLQENFNPINHATLFEPHHYNHHHHHHSNSSNSNNNTNSPIASFSPEFKSIIDFDYINSPTINSHGLTDSAFSLLDPNQSRIYDQYKVDYAEILYRYGMLEKRAEVLKFINNTSIMETSKTDYIGFSIDCYKCSRRLNNFYCNFCKVYIFKCSICNNSVRGLSSFCVICGHGGHTDHIKKWFEKQTKCPSGCGCSCVLNYRPSSCASSTNLTSYHSSQPVNNNTPQQMSRQSSATKVNTRRFSISMEEDFGSGDYHFHEMLVNSPPQHY